MIIIYWDIDAIVFLNVNANSPVRRMTVYYVLVIVGVKIISD